MDRRRQLIWARAAAAAVFLCAAGGELLRILLDKPWVGFRYMSHVIGGILAVVWTFAGVAMLLRSRRRAIFDVVAWDSAWPATAMLMGHGAAVTWGSMVLGTPRWGLIVMAAAAAQVWLVRKAFGRGIVYTPAFADARAMASA